MSEVLTALEQAPLPAIVRSLGIAISEAQREIDKNVIAQLMELADPEKGVQLPGDSRQRSLLELGLMPSFYHFNQATIEARVAFTAITSSAFSISASIAAGATVGFAFVAASVSASYSNRYSFEASGSSVISTQLVSVPAPALLTEIVSRAAFEKAKQRP